MKTKIVILIFILMQIVTARASIETPSDGKSGKFTITRVENDAVFNSDTTQILLRAHLDTLTTNFDDGLSLGVNLWVYPNETFSSGDDEYIVHATDLDEIMVDGSQLYLITDQNQGGKVIIYNPKTQEATQAWIDEDERVPVDASFMGNGSGSKILVTYQASNSVSVVNYFAGETVWDYNTVFPDNRLDSPSDAVYVSADSLHGYLIADEGNNRILFVDADSQTVTWTFTDNEQLRAPTDIEYIKSTHEVLITDKNNHRILIVEFGTDNVNWSFGAQDSVSSDSIAMQKPVDADYNEEDGTIYVADAGNDRLFSINRYTNEFWSFYGDVVGIEDVDRLSDGSIMLVKEIHGESDNQVNDGKHLPAIINFKDDIVELAEIFEVPDGKYVNFKNIFWETSSLPESTSVEVQFKSGITRHLLDELWLGPEGDTNRWFTVDSTELSDIHVGHRFYTFRFKLRTQKKTETPIVSLVGVDYEYYDSSLSPAPNIFTYGVIGDSMANAIVDWKSFRWVQIPPRDETKVRYHISLVDVNTNQPIEKFTTNESDFEKNLENLTGLQNVNAIRISARPETDDNSMTPILDYWEVTYDINRKTSSSMFFVDENDSPVDGYVATTTYPPTDAEEQVDLVRLWLNDDNAETQGNTINLTINAAHSGDVEQADLSIVAPFNAYSIENPIPIIVIQDSSMVTAANDTFEVFDRDMLSVSYVDAGDETDIATDSVIVRQSTRGELFVETSAGDPVQQTYLGQQIYVRITGENDKNIDQFNQDSLLVTIKNIDTEDSERIYLKEVGENGIYNSSNFQSTRGILLRNDNQSANNDGLLYCRGGDIIQVIYKDNFTLRSTIEVLSIIVDPQNANSPLVVEAAPNPFYASRRSGIGLRFSTNSRARIQQIDIFNLAGELVNSFDHYYIDYYTSAENATIQQDEQIYLEPNWWNLQNAVGNEIASGTYWFIVKADVLDDDDSILRTVSEMVKVVIIR